MDKDLRKFSGYAHLYENHYITPWGNERKEYKLGNPSETIEGLPDAHEYDVSKYKYVGIVRLETEMIDDTTLLNNKMDNEN